MFLRSFDDLAFASSPTKIWLGRKAMYEGVLLFPYSLMLWS
jgi:hypothetical protein